MIIDPETSVPLVHSQRRTTPMFEGSRGILKIDPHSTHHFIQGDRHKLALMNSTWKQERQEVVRPYIGKIGMELTENSDRHERRQC
jgi:hypothetical protein